MLMPGLSSARVPMRIRLLIAIAMSLALAPLVAESSVRLESQDQPALAVSTAAIEVIVGISLGLTARILFSALQFAGSAAGMMVGLQAPQGSSFEDDQSTDTFAELFTITAAVLFFLLDLHVDVIIALARTYELLPIRGDFIAANTVDALVATLSRGYVSALQVISPFVAYSILANLVFAVANKMVPQFPAYFVSVPFILGGGLILAFFVIAGGEEVFFKEFSRLIAKEFGG